MASQKQVGAPAPMTPEDASLDVLVGQIRQQRACLEMAMRRGGMSGTRDAATGLPIFPGRIEVSPVGEHQCALCGLPAEYDLRTRSGMWGWLCREHAGTEGIGLGTGVGQRLVKGDGEAKPAEATATAIQEGTAV